MPKPTFLNLPDAKRDRIVQLALSEFAQRPFAQASLSRIVAQAGIAKGSIYQYFDNKLDLYRWLLTDELPRRKMAAIAAGAPPAGASIWHVLEAAYLAGFRFALAEPTLARFATRSVQETDPAIRALHRANDAAGAAWLRALVQGGQASGELRADLDVDLAVAYLNTTLGDGMLHLLARACDAELHDLLADPSLTARLSEADVSALVRGVLDLLRRGLAPRPPPPSPESP